MAKQPKEVTDFDSEPLRLLERREMSTAGISVQRTALKNRSAHSRGGWEISAGKRAKAA